MTEYLRVGRTATVIRKATAKRWEEEAKAFSPASRYARKRKRPRLNSRRKRRARAHGELLIDQTPEIRRTFVNKKRVARTARKLRRMGEKLKGMFR